MVYIHIFDTLFDALKEELTISVHSTMPLCSEGACNSTAIIRCDLKKAIVFKDFFCCRGAPFRVFLKTANRPMQQTDPLIVVDVVPVYLFVSISPPVVHSGRRDLFVLSSCSLIFYSNRAGRKTSGCPARGPRAARNKSPTQLYRNSWSARFSA